jgi:DNA-binding GntR family transcriptional regulator
MSSVYSPQRPLKTLPLQISDQIAQSIIDGAFGPGERLLETDLAESFQVSRSTIREALRLLEQRGLVRIRPQRGAHVTQLSTKELDDLFEVRASLLATGSGLAAAYVGPKEAEVLRGLLKKMKASVGDANRYTTLSGEMIETIMKFSRNDVLAYYINDFALRIGRYVRMGLLFEERRRASLKCWENLVEALIRGDGDQAAKLHRELALSNRSAALEVFLSSQAGYPVKAK